MTVHNPLGTPPSGAVAVQILQQACHVLVEVETEIRLQARAFVELQELKNAWAKHKPHAL